MKLEAALPALREGKKLCINWWDSGVYFDAFGVRGLTLSEVMDDDWEVVEEYEEVEVWRWVLKLDTGEYVTFAHYTEEEARDIGPTPIVGRVEETKKTERRLKE